jgi:hypothetical protein
MSRVLLLLLAALIALAPGHALAQGPRPLTVAADEVIHGDLASVSQPIIVIGMVEGDVTSWSGSITVLGEVRGDVVSYAGGITLGPDAQVRGSVLSLGGGVLREGRALVAGRTLGQEPLSGGLALASAAKLFEPQRGVAAAVPPLPLISVALALMFLLLATICALIWPQRTLGVSLAIRRAPGRAAAFGLLTTALAALLLLPLGGLIALSLVGLPLLLPLTLIMQAPYVFGLAGLGLALGTQVRPGAPQALAVALGVALLLLPLTLIGVLSPLWSMALFYLAASVGLGAAILSRGGAYAIRARV